jgi:hypothetical protein
MSATAINLIPSRSRSENAQEGEPSEGKPSYDAAALILAIDRKARDFIPAMAAEM